MSEERRHTYVQPCERLYDVHLKQDLDDEALPEGDKYDDFDLLAIEAAERRCVLAWCCARARLCVIL